MINLWEYLTKGVDDPDAIRMASCGRCGTFFAVDIEGGEENCGSCDRQVLFEEETITSTRSPEGFEKSNNQKIQDLLFG